MALPPAYTFILGTQRYYNQPRLCTIPLLSYSSNLLATNNIADRGSVLSHWMITSSNGSVQLKLPWVALLPLDLCTEKKNVSRIRPTKMVLSNLRLYFPRTTLSRRLPSVFEVVALCSPLTSYLIGDIHH